jgi:hypothetical protein
MENKVNEGDVYATDDGEFLVMAAEGFMQITKHGVYVYTANIDSAYLHSVRATPIGNLKEALCQLSL